MINRVARPAMGRNAFSSSSATPTVLIPWAWIVAKKPCGARRPRKANGTLHGTGSFHHTATLVKLLSNLIARWVLDPKSRCVRMGLATFLSYRTYRSLLGEIYENMRKIWAFARTDRNVEARSWNRVRWAQEA